MAERVLMIEDDETLSGMVDEYLGTRGIEVTTRPEAESGLRLPKQNEFDALILNIMLPDLDGFEVCRRVRSDSDIPILMLTARGEDTDRIVGLELGARLRAILRRRGAPSKRAQPSLRFGRLEIDRKARLVHVEGQAKTMTNHQFELLCILAENAGRVMSRESLMNRLRGHGLEAFDRSIDVHISRIRAAIEADPKHPRRVITIPRAGYVFAQKQDDDSGAR